MYKEENSQVPNKHGHISRRSPLLEATCQAAPTPFPCADSGVSSALENVGFKGCLDHQIQFCMVDMNCHFKNLVAEDTQEKAMSTATQLPHRPPTYSLLLFLGQMKPN